MYKNLYADPREEKAQAALFKGQEYFEAEMCIRDSSLQYATSPMKEIAQT